VDHILNGVFRLSRKGTNTAIPFRASVDSSGPSTVVTLSFPTRLSDGDYTLFVLGGKVADSVSNASIGDIATAFHRFYGDIDGSRTINNIDLAAFRSTYGRRAGELKFNPSLDYNGDGRVDAKDLSQFNVRAKRKHL
jgi:hypothetical protein